MLHYFMGGISDLNSVSFRNVKVGFWRETSESKAKRFPIVPANEVNSLSFKGFYINIC